MGKTIKYISEHSFAWFVLFVLMPAVYIEKYLLDYESAPRFILLSALCFFFSVVFLLKKNQSNNFNFIRTPYFLLAGIFLLLTGIQVMRALNPGEALREWIRLALFFFLIIILCQLIRRKPEFRNHMVTGIVTASLIFILLSFWEQRAALLKLFREGAALQLDKYDASTLVNKNFFAETLTLCFPFALAGSFHFKGWMRYVSLLCSAFILLMLILLHCVSAWIAIACSVMAVGLVLLFAGKKTFRLSSLKLSKPLVMLLSMAMIVLAVLFFKYKGPEALNSKLLLLKEYLVHPPDIISESEKNKNSIFERYMLLRNTSLLIKDHWITGVGLANWKIVFPKYGISGTDFINEGSIHYDHPHNDFLFIWSELGLAGIILYILLFALPLKKLITGIKNNGTGMPAGFMVAAIFSIISFLVLSLSEFPRLRMYSMVITAVTCALALSARQDDTGNPDPSLNKPFKPALLLLLMMLVSATGVYAGVMKFNGEYHMKKELLYRTSRKYERAEKESRLARSYFFTADLTGTPLYWYMGVNNFYDKNPEGAMHYFNMAEQESPYHTLVLKDLGTLYSAKGDYTTALTYFDRALEARPLHYDALLNKSALYYNMRNIDSAFATIQKIHSTRYRNNKRYKEILNEILYTKAYFLTEKFPEEDKKKFLEKIEDPSWLIMCFEPTLSGNSPFDSTLIHNFHAGK